jgi:hypothetical protein
MHSSRRIITTTLIATIAAGALSASALAYPIGPRFGVSYTTHSATPFYSRQDKQLITPVTYTAQPVARVSTPTGGFTPLDTGFAAAGGLALLALTAGSGVALARRRSRGLHQPAATTSRAM